MIYFPGNVNFTSPFGVGRNLIIFACVDLWQFEQSDEEVALIFDRWV